MVRRIVTVSLLFLMTLSAWVVILPAKSAGNAVLSFSPAQSSTTFPQPVTINVTLNNVVNLNGWQIKVRFNPAVLYCLAANITIPSDNLLAPSGAWEVFGNITDNTAGYVSVILALGGTQGVSGSGTLCQLVFNVLKPGMSALSFADVGIKYRGTVLLDPALNLIPFSSLSGTVVVGTSGFQFYTFLCVENGARFNVTLFTNSTVSSFSYYNTTDSMTFFLSTVGGNVGMCMVSIPIAMMNAPLAVLLNGSANYFSQTEDGVNRYLNFSYSQSTLRVDIFATVPGDLNGDRQVDMMDVAIVAYAFLSTPGSLRWNPMADVYGSTGVADGIVDMMDISFVASKFGSSF